MNSKIFLAALLLGGTVPAVAADTDAAPAAPKKEYVCLRYHDVDGWGTRDKHSMVVNDRFGRKYLVSLNGICDDLNYAFGAGFRPIGGVAAGGCVDRGDRVVMGGGGVSHIANTCWVNKIQNYTKDMEAADRLARENKQPLATY